MKKIIAAFDGLHYSESTQQYAIDMALESNAHLVGVFLDDVTYHSYKMWQVVGNGGVDEEKWDMLEGRDKAARLEATALFDEACREAGLEFTIHHDRNVAINELLHESIYADMVIIDKKECFSSHEGKMPSFFLRDLLSDIQCPVLLVPETYHKIERMTLLYDGSPSSVFAVRSFSYLFPEFKRLPVEVVSVNKTENGLHVPDNRLMKEFMNWHFRHAAYNVLRGDAEDEILAHLALQPAHTVLVLGAYQRNRVSRWFKASMADVLMEKTELPLFVAHK